jgi:hypothetical protein
MSDAVNPSRPSLHQAISAGALVIFTCWLACTWHTRRLFYFCARCCCALACISCCETMASNSACDMPAAGAGNEGALAVGCASAGAAGGAAALPAEETEADTGCASHQVFSENSCKHNSTDAALRTTIMALLECAPLFFGARILSLRRRSSICEQRRQLPREKAAREGKGRILCEALMHFLVVEATIVLKEEVRLRALMHVAVLDAVVHHLGCSVCHHRPPSRSNARPTWLPWRRCSQKPL